MVLVAEFLPSILDCSIWHKNDDFFGPWALTFLTNKVLLLAMHTELVDRQFVVIRWIWLYLSKFHRDAK